MAENDEMIRQIDAAARAIAEEFDYGWVFGDSEDDPGNYDADHWRRIAAKALDAAQGVSKGQGADS